MLSVPFVFSMSRFQGPAFRCDKIVVIVTLVRCIAGSVGLMFAILRILRKARGNGGYSMFRETDLRATVANNCHGNRFFTHGKINFAAAKSISPRQNQFHHCKINFATAKSISPRQNQFHHGKIIFIHGKIIFIHGKINFTTAKSFSRRHTAWPHMSNTTALIRSAILIYDPYGP